MAWYIEDVRIFTQDIQDEAERVIAELQPVDDWTVTQELGKVVPKVSLNAYIVGSGDKTTIENYVYSGTLCTLSGPEGVLANYKINKANFSRTEAIRQTIRTDLPLNSPVYIVDFELRENV